MDGITKSTDMSLSQPRELVIDRKAWCAQSMGSQRAGHNWATEMNLLVKKKKKKKKVAVHIGEILSSRIYGIIIKYPLHFYRCVLYNALWKDGTVLHLHSSTWKYVFIHGLTKHCVLIFAFFKLWVWANVFVFKSHIVPL